MSSSTAIGSVSQSLRNLLLGEMILRPRVRVTILGPDERGGNRRVNLFLYKVQESPPLKNLDWQVKNNDSTRIVPPPLSLNLYYLMTPYARNDPETGDSTAHEYLGDAMRVFYENPIIPQEYLVDELKESREQFKIILNTLDLDQLSNVWTTFSEPYRLSVPYEVSVVQLDMLSEREKIMARRVREIGVPTIKAPYKPPEIGSIDPISGPVGTLVTVTGKNLIGWKAYVFIMGTKIIDAQDLTQDSFQITLPATLQAGFHEIHIDISHLCRRTFFFEVTS